MVMSFMSETWVEVHWLPDVPVGTLSVSDLGRVKRHGHAYMQKGRWGTEHLWRKPPVVLSPWLGNHGYWTIAVMIKGKRIKVLLHRLMARAFVPGYSEGLHVNHINGDKGDNRPENLEWVTASRNTQLQWETGLVNLRGDAHPSKKLTSGKVRIIRELLKLGARQCDLAILCDVSDSTIGLIAAGKRWNAVS
jgi:hypothetical protein